MAVDAIAVISDRAMILVIECARFAVWFARKFAAWYARSAQESTHVAAHY